MFSRHRFSPATNTVIRHPLDAVKPKTPKTWGFRSEIGHQELAETVAKSNKRTTRREREGEEDAECESFGGFEEFISESELSLYLSAERLFCSGKIRSKWWSPRTGHSLTLTTLSSYVSLLVFTITFQAVQRFLCLVYALSFSINFLHFVPKMKVRLWALFYQSESFLFAGGFRF